MSRAIERPVIPQTKRQPPQGKLSFQEFLEWLDEDTWAEWVEGEVEMVSPATTQHQRVQGFLWQVLGIFVRARGLGEVLGAPYLIELPSVLRGREPDLIFVAVPRRLEAEATYLEGAPELVVEIVSPQSVARDRGSKFVEYEAAGVAEYWLIDLLRRRAEFYQLDAEGRYALAFGGAAGVYRSMVVPSFWLRVEWLWQEPLPPPWRTVAEIAGVDAALVDAFERALMGKG
ncbi:MAG: Uma2 family endonuclease [Anaerolineae bacterium]|nr:Uma2 family endonuclease [Anaerolineae bacterium]